MAVKHFVTKNNIICGTKAKKPLTTEVKELVTCKRCLKKLGIVIPKKDATQKPKKDATQKPKNRTIEKNQTKRKKPLGIHYIKDKKWGHCLKINSNVLLKIGDDLDDKVNVLIIISTEGMMSTSMKFANTLQLLKVKEANYLRGWFINHKMHNGGVVYVHEVKEAFEKE